MKHLFTIILIGFAFAETIAQTATPEETVKQFFTAMHAKDTATLKTLVADKVIFQTVMTRDDESKAQMQDFNKFLQSVASIPETMSFEEVILDYKTRVDGTMANVWTPYNFMLNEELSHCGVNSFTMILTGGKWKIFHLVDTRRKDCD